MAMPEARLCATARAGILMLALLAFAFPANAHGSTTIGQLDPATPTGSCMGTSYWVQNASAGPSYAVPSKGVITAWSHKAGAAAGRQLGLRVFRLVSGVTYTLAGTSGIQTLTPGSLNSFATRIPVVAGDRLGLYVGNPGTGFPDLGGGASCSFSGGIGDLVNEGSASPEPAVGANTNLVGVYTGIYRLNVTAKVEPDVDGDGYGDETQDACPANPATTAVCAPPKDKKGRRAPRGKITGKSDSVKDNAVSVKVTADVAVTATTTGTVRVPHASRVYRLVRTKTSLAANVTKKLKLAIPRKARRPIARALSRHRRTKAKLTIVLEDAAGNTSTLKSSVALRR
jgi:hypothetical protein